MNRGNIRHRHYAVANFVDLRNRLVAEFGEDQRTEIAERLKLARVAKHLPPARSRGGRKAAELTTLDCAVAILALISSNNAYEAADQLTALRALQKTSWTLRVGDGPPIDLFLDRVPEDRLDAGLADYIDKQREGWALANDFTAFPEDFKRNMELLIESMQKLWMLFDRVPSRIEIIVGTDPLGAVIDQVWAEDEGKLVGTTRAIYGENIPPARLWLGSVRIVTGEIIDIMADILGPYEDAD